MFIRADVLRVWQNPSVRERLSWYYDVMTDRRPAKFLVCKRIPVDVDLKAADEAGLWREHHRAAVAFRRAFGPMAHGEKSLEDLERPAQSFLDLKVELLNRIVTHCTLCEWKCRVDRVKALKKGACKMDATARVSTWFHHFGEEPPLVGAGGSGTIFFAGCPFRCVFCQNWDISQDPLNGAPVDGAKLVLIMKSLRREGALNINFVGGEPTPNLHVIVDGMRRLETNVPMLWNSDMYLTQEAMELLVDVIDIWLPDFKYGNNACALRLSKVMNYYPIVARNHAIAQNNGDMIIRHLVLPNHVECCTKPVLEWIAANCPRALVNVMGQYHPDHLVPLQSIKYAEIARRVSREEMQAAYRMADQLGLVYEPVS